MTDEVKLTRTERRQRESRSKLLWATLSTVARDGVNGASILDITTRADVAIGSFYNYFESKEAAIHAVVAELLGTWRAALRDGFAHLPDPAERVAFKTRHTMARASENPDWAAFFVRTAWLMTSEQAEYPAALYDDLDEGIASGRFVGSDLEMTAVSVIGLLYAAIARLVIHKPDAEAATRTTIEVLRILGIENGEAKQLIAVPLPSLDLPPILHCPAPIVGR